jgi:hypothetical protein
MELPDAVLKIGAAGRWQHFQKDFFYRLVSLLLESKLEYISLRVNKQEGASYGLSTHTWKW